jgi:Domain of unknown function DUF302
MDLPRDLITVFGRPCVGSPLMQADPRLGIGLPLRVRAWNQGGQTIVGYNDPGGSPVPTSSPRRFWNPPIPVFAPRATAQHADRHSTIIDPADKGEVSGGTALGGTHGCPVQARCLSSDEP